MMLASRNADKNTMRKWKVYSLEPKASDDMVPANVSSNARKQRETAVRKSQAVLKESFLDSISLFS